MREWREGESSPSVAGEVAAGASSAEGEELNDAQGCNEGGARTFSCEKAKPTPRCSSLV